MIKFSKAGEIKFISHLDLLRTMQKIIRRSGLPVEYSQGFNPHMATSIAQPLAVGVYSIGEYMDVDLIEEVDGDVIVNKLNQYAPSGIEIFKAIRVKEKKDRKIPQTMALLDAADYSIKIKYEDSEVFLEGIKRLMELDNWNILKKSKKSEKEVDIRPMIKSIEYSKEDDYIKFNVRLSCGSRENLSADLFVTFIKENCDGINKLAFVDIERKEMYAEKNGKYVAIDKMF